MWTAAVDYTTGKLYMNKLASAGGNLINRIRHSWQRDDGGPPATVVDGG
jgi:hypothetical protein